VGDGRSCPPKKGAAAMEGEGAGDGNLAEKSGIKIWSFDDRFYDRKFIELK